MSAAKIIDGVEIHIPPFKPVGGKVTVQPLPYKPSKTIEIYTHDKADENEGIVVALSDCQYGRKYDKKKGWEHNGHTFPHELQLFDRVIFPGSYQDEGVMRFNGVKYRTIESWEIQGIVDAERPEGFTNPQTGDVQLSTHPMLVR